MERKGSMVSEMICGPEPWAGVPKCAAHASGHGSSKLWNDLQTLQNRERAMRSLLSCLLCSGQEGCSQRGAVRASRLLAFERSGVLGVLTLQLSHGLGIALVVLANRGAPFAA